jgi:glycosyltransferase involved in cell wall biosynthesis
MAPLLSVLICTYRRPEGLARLLDAVVPQLSASREIVVVNDGSHDNAYGQVTTRHAANIRYRALKTNGGIAAARNAAAALAEGAYLVFTDDDCEPPAFWLDWLEARLSEHPELDLVHVRERGSLQHQRPVLDRRAGDRALVGPRPQVRQPRSAGVA